MGVYTPVLNYLRLALFILACLLGLMAVLHKPRRIRALKVAIFIAVAAFLFPQFTRYKDGGSVELWTPMYQVIYWHTLENVPENGIEVHFYPNNFTTITEWKEKYRNSDKPQPEIPITEEEREWIERRFDYLPDETFSRFDLSEYVMSKEVTPDEKGNIKKIKYSATRYINDVPTTDCVEVYYDEGENIYSHYYLSIGDRSYNISEPYRKYFKDIKMDDIREYIAEIDPDFVFEGSEIYISFAFGQPIRVVAFPGMGDVPDYYPGLDYSHGELHEINPDLIWNNIPDDLSVPKK